jgi:hypothetical protein
MTNTVQRLGDRYNQRDTNIKLLFQGGLPILLSTFSYGWSECIYEKQRHCFGGGTEYQSEAHPFWIGGGYCSTEQGLSPRT